MKVHVDLNNSLVVVTSASKQEVSTILKVVLDEEVYDPFAISWFDNVMMIRAIDHMRAYELYSAIEMVRIGLGRKKA